jgi:hypothetical protein
MHPEFTGQPLVVFLFLIPDTTPIVAPVGAVAIVSIADWQSETMHTPCSPITYTPTGRPSRATP